MKQKEESNDTKQILPFRAYTLRETANLLSISPGSLRNMISEKDEFVQTVGPHKVGKDWRFMGDKILNALGTAVPEVNR